MKSMQVQWITPTHTTTNTKWSSIFFWISFIVLGSYAPMVHITCEQVHLRERWNEWIRINTYLQGYRSHGMLHPLKIYISREWVGQYIPHCFRPCSHSKTWGKQILACWDIDVRGNRHWLRQHRKEILQNTQGITSSDRITTVESSQVQWYWFQGIARLQMIYKIQQTKVVPVVPWTSIQNTNGNKPSQFGNQSLISMSLRTPYFALSATTTLVNWGQFRTTENLQASEPLIHEWVHISIKYENV